MIKFKYLIKKTLDSVYFISYKKQNMIREFRQSDMAAAMEIWIATNAKAHNFIFEEYYMSMKMMPRMKF